MKFDEFIGQVQHRARLATTDEALKATRATLSTFAERLAGGAAQNLAGQLPQEIGRFLDTDDAASADRFSLEEFFQRIAEKEQADLPAATHHARAVLSVVDQATGGTLEKERDQLPDDWARLFSDVRDFQSTYAS